MFFFTVFPLQIKLMLCGVLPIFLCTCLDIDDEIEFLGKVHTESIKLITCNSKHLEDEE